MHQPATPLRVMQHTMMAWFEVGCIGLLTANVLAYRTFTDETSKEAHDLVYTVNLVMHFLWGLHNLHLSIKGFFYDKGAENEFRRPQVFGIYSLTGAARNYFALTYGPSDEATKATWTIEWASSSSICSISLRSNTRGEWPRGGNPGRQRAAKRPNRGF